MEDMLGFIIDTDGLPGDEAACAVASFGVGGSFWVECWRPDGSLAWSSWAKNMIPNAAINDNLNVIYGGSAATTAYYVMMIDNAGFAALSANDTMASHPGWTENTNTSLANRPTWTPAAAASQSISNTTQVSIPMNPGSPIMLRGFALASANGLGGTTGKLGATALLPTPQSCSSGDTLKLTYIINGTTT
jgi:hypothetical protein